MYNFSDVFKLSLCEPERVVSYDSIATHYLVGDSFATRIPSGAQAGLPSQLDYALCSRALLSDGEVHWSLACADHALISYLLKCEPVTMTARPKRVWKCKDTSVFRFCAEAILGRL